MDDPLVHIDSNSPRGAGLLCILQLFGKLFLLVGITLGEVFIGLSIAKAKQVEVVSGCVGMDPLSKGLPDVGSNRPLAPSTSLEPNLSGVMAHCLFELSQFPIGQDLTGTASPAGFQALYPVFIEP